MSLHTIGAPIATTRIRHFGDFACRIPIMEKKELVHLSDDDPVRKLITETPDLKSNPVGVLVHNALVNKLEGATPGRHSEFLRSGDTFRSIFFPKYSSPEKDVVSSYIGLDDEWWSDFSVAVLCQSMYYQTSDLRPQLMIDDINSAVDDHNTNLRSEVVKLYSHALICHFMKYSGNLEAAKTKYIQNICTPEWVTYKEKQYNDGTLKNPEWEEFNHWAKLSGLGASDAEIANTINTLKSMGLRILPDVDVDTWRSYTSPWFDDLSHSDIDSDARDGEVRSEYIPSWGPYPVFMKEENSFEFTADSQPGNKYRQPPSGSCFTGDTLVLLKGGFLKPIKDITSDEYVQTWSGCLRKVMFVSSPPTGNRSMYSINGLGFKFTRTHPFLNAVNTGPRYLAISPLSVLHMIPMLSYEGVGQMAVGSKLLGFSLSTATTCAIDVTKIEEVSVSGELVYDLILEPDSSGQFEYIVGTSDALFVVTSELPAFHNCTNEELAAGATILKMVSSGSDLHSALYDKVGHDNFRGKLHWEIHKISSYLFSIPADHSSVSSSGDEVNLKSKSDFLSFLTKSMEYFCSNGFYNVPGGIAFEYLMSALMLRIASHLTLSHRITPKNVASTNILALSLLDVHLISSPLTDEVAIFIDINGTTTDCVIKIQDAGLGRFGARINKVQYMSFPLPSKEVVDVKFKLAINGGTCTLTSSTYMYRFPFEGQLYYRLPVFGTDGVEIGMLNIDMRCLTKSEMEEEKASNEKNIDICDHVSNTGVQAYLEHLVALTSV